MDTRRRVGDWRRVWAWSASALLLCLGASACVGASGTSPIKADEEVIFFPTFAFQDGGASSWTASVHGWIFEPVGQTARAPFERLLRERAEVSEEQSRSNIFRERTEKFFVDNERSKTLSVNLSGRTITLKPSKANGHFEDLIALGAVRGQSGEWLDIGAVTPPGEKRTFAGRIQLIGPRGVSVVSDIDDTIKISEVLDKRKLVANTFLLPFRPAPGMSELYRRWAAEGGAVFHYVSAGPWQLYPVLADFVTREGFPAGSFHMRPFRLKDRSAAEFLENRTEEYKLGVIDPLIRRFPGRRFVLVGDSGERDPEIYAELAKRFPDQVKAILIRNVTGESLTSPRFVELAAKVPVHVRRHLFRDTAELANFAPRALVGP